MKRITALILVLLLTVLSAAACGTNGLADYKKAAEKTDQIAKGQCSAEFDLNMDFNTDGLSQEDISELEYYKNMSGSFQSSYDHEKHLGIYRNYLNLGGLGFDFDLYKNNSEMFVKLPVVGKYMKLDDLLEQAVQSQTPQPEMISEDTLEALGREWVGILNEEDVFKGKDIILTTPDGEVKTTVYTITLNDDQVKSLEEKALTIFARDENLKRNFTELAEKKTDHEMTATFDEFITEMKAGLKHETIEKFQYTAYVDIDGYIVNETVEVKIKKDELKPGKPKAIQFSLNMKNWNINKDQKFDFPVLTDENTTKPGDLDQTMPSLFRNLFQNNQKE